MEGVSVAIMESGYCFAVCGRKDVGGMGIGEVGEMFGEDGDGSWDWVCEAAEGLC